MPYDPTDEGEYDETARPIEEGFFEEAGPVSQEEWDKLGKYRRLEKAVRQLFTRHYLIVTGQLAKEIETSLKDLEVP